VTTEFLLDLMKQGIAVAVAALAIWIALRFYRDMKEMREAHEKERKEWETRYVTKAENYAEKNHELARSLQALMEAIERRLLERRARDTDRRGGG
jgi:hypothetical protein